jgi:hypothetical protein
MLQQVRSISVAYEMTSFSVCFATPKKLHRRCRVGASNDNVSDQCFGCSNVLVPINIVQGVMGIPNRHDVTASAKEPAPISPRHRSIAKQLTEKCIMDKSTLRSIWRLQMRVFFVSAPPASASFFWPPIDTIPVALMNDYLVSAH